MRERVSFSIAVVKNHGLETSDATAIKKTMTLFDFFDQSFRNAGPLDMECFRCDALSCDSYV